MSFRSGIKSINTHNFDFLTNTMLLRLPPDGQPNALYAAVPFYYDCFLSFFYGLPAFSHFFTACPQFPIFFTEKCHKLTAFSHFFTACRRLYKGYYCNIVLVKKVLFSPMQPSSLRQAARGGRNPAAFSSISA